MAAKTRAQASPPEPEGQDLTGRAYQGLRQMLFFNELAPGQKLRYRDLAERLGMSPTPVIQALKWLEFQGLVRHEPNRGFYLEPVSLEEVQELYELRETLELELLPRTLERLDDAGLARLGAALQAHLEASEERYLKRRLLTDMEFHLTLAALSGRTVTVRVLRQLFDLLYLKHKGEILFYRPMSSAEVEHRRVFERVAARDLEGAREALVSHIRGVRDHVLAGIRKVFEEKEGFQF
ncbi:MAG: GntR family transcriptional regulator [Deferrisomatales bacterium]